MSQYTKCRRDYIVVVIKCRVIKCPGLTVAVRSVAVLNVVESVLGLYKLIQTPCKSLMHAITLQFLDHEWAYRLKLNAS